MYNHVMYTDCDYMQRQHCCNRYSHINVITVK